MHCRAAELSVATADSCWWQMRLRGCTPEAAAGGSQGGLLKLPLIKNKKTVNPRDADTAAVFQLETAMGSAIECFRSAGAVVVPRTRFAPVKTCNDLFVLRSDAYKVRCPFLWTPNIGSGQFA